MEAGKELNFDLGPGSGFTVTGSPVLSKLLHLLSLKKLRSGGWTASMTLRLFFPFTSACACPSHRLLQDRSWDCDNASPNPPSPKSSSEQTVTLAPVLSRIIKLRALARDV